jgi:hypothetical protein
MNIKRVRLNLTNKYEYKTYKNYIIVFKATITNMAAVEDFLFGPISYKLNLEFT